MFGFGSGKNQREKKQKYTVDTENLAVPEIHIGALKKENTDETEEKSEESITYDEVAVPEIHVRKKKK